MLTRDQRLKGKKNFENIFRQARPRWFGHLKIRQIDNLEFGSKIGIIVSNKVSKKAVERNRIKRQLRAIFRKLIAQGKINQQTVVVTVIKKPNLSHSYELLNQDVEKWLKNSY